MNPGLTALLDLAAAAPPERRSAILDQQCPDPAMRQEVVELLRYADEAECLLDDAIQGVAASLRVRHEPAAGDLIGSYRIVSLIGRGGMGSVYRAERADGEVEQTVALKVLRGDGQRAGWRERFLNERQLLATLQHPTIVRLFDAGRTTDGRPYLVMELVEGVSIDRYAAGLDLRKRLKLFLRLCEGVSHAHRRLVIHRDLKPSNILVDAAGEPKLLDFGIAELLSAAPDAIRPREQLLTPEYASPEQLRGEPQTTATDVYSLGAVLYLLLTGTAARANVRALPVEQPTPPSRLNRRVPRDVDFVIEKALRPEPEERYGSVDDFAADIRAVLRRRAVQARAGNRWYRARMVVRRYWAPVLPVCVVVASLACGLAIAERERSIARQRFTDVRRLADRLFDIDAQVAQLPGGAKTRQLIVDTALEYLRRIAGDGRTDPGLALELGAAYMRVARVQGVNISANLGQTQAAENSEREAQAMIDGVLRAEPKNRVALLRAGQIAHDRMILAGDAHHEIEAQRFARAAMDRLNEYLAADAARSGDRMETQQVVLALINIANRYVNSGDYDEGMRIARRAADIAKATEWPAQAGAALMVIAFAERDSGDLDQALQSIRESVRVLEPSRDDHRTGRLQTYSLALIREGQILGEAGGISLARRAEAVKILERARAIGDDFAARDPGDFQSQYRVFSADVKIAAIIRDRQPSRALEYYDDALRRLSAMQGNGGMLRNESTALAGSAYPLLRLGRTREARMRVDAAFERLRRGGEYPADQVEPGSTVVDTLRALAECEVQGDHGVAAAGVYRDVIRLLDGAGPSVPVTLQDALRVSEVFRDAARVLRNVGQPEEAAGLEFRRLKIWREWVAKRPDSAFIRRQLDAARNDRGD